MESSQIAALMLKLQEAFIPEKAEGMKGVFQCHVTGVENGDWLMKVENATCSIQSGTVVNPKATLELADKDLGDLLYGKLDPLKAFFTGRIRLSGDTGAVIKLLSMFHLNPDRFV